MTFHIAPTANEATSLSSCIALPKLSPRHLPATNTNTAPPVLLPWVGYGTYRLGHRHAHSAVLSALRTGYRHIDTAFVYGGQTTEVEVGRAIRQALQEKVLDSRQDVFVTTKQWREYHGYDASLKCLEMSLERLGLEYVDCWMMHWPGPCWESRQKVEQSQDMSLNHDNIITTSTQENGDDRLLWSRAKPGMQKDQIASLRAETWRAMEDAYKSGKTRSIAVSNFSIHHLQTLKQTATLWPPAINQIECHPYYPQKELVEYCQKEGIVVQAYASLGGQDGTKAKWKELGGKLLECPAVIMAAKNHSVVQQRIVTPGQVLLRWALQRNCAVVPKTVCPDRMRENDNVFDFTLNDDEMNEISKLGDDLNGGIGRICWRTEPLRMLDFD